MSEVQSTLTAVARAWEYRRQESRCEAMLDRAVTATLSRLGPEPPTPTDTICVAAARSVASVKLVLAPSIPAPVEAPRGRDSICVCERSSYALQVARASEYNERRAPDAAPWVVPEVIVDAAARHMAKCKAAIHFPSLTQDTWFGFDVKALDLEDKDQRIEAYRRYEDALADQSSRSVTGERWEGEFESYEETDRFVRELTATRRSQLAALLTRLGQDVNDPKIVTWVTTRIRAKHGNALRGYCSCIYSLRRKVTEQQAV